MNAKDTLVMILTVLALCVVSFLAGGLCRSCTYHRGGTGEEIRDTIVRIDTIRPEPIVKVMKVVDSIPVPYPVYHEKTDTLWQRDTLVHIDTLYLPRTQKYYGDDTYEAWVSGYQPALDSIRVFSKATEVKSISVPPRKRWGIGIHAGYGVSVNGTGVVASPYIGVGISYDLFSW